MRKKKKGETSFASGEKRRKKKQYTKYELPYNLAQKHTSIRYGAKEEELEKNREWWK